MTRRLLSGPGRNPRENLRLYWGEIQPNLRALDKKLDKSNVMKNNYMAAFCLHDRAGHRVPTK
ncbi:MAG: hypothetical protein WD078_00805 [Woeseia sp.]